MTVIAYRDGVLAADTLITAYHCRVGHTVKISRVNGWLLGASGSLGSLHALEDWALEPDVTAPIKWPDKADSTGLLISPDGDLFYSSDEAPGLSRNVTPFTAIGSGGEIALTAMALGKSAVDAVKLGMHINIGCGGKALWLNLDGTEDLEIPVEIYNFLDKS